MDGIQRSTKRFMKDVTYSSTSASGLTRKKKLNRQSKWSKTDPVPYSSVVSMFLAVPSIVEQYEEANFVMI